MLRALLQSRAGIVDQMTALVTAAEGENRDLNAEETASFDRLKADLAALDVRIDRARAVETAGAASSAGPLSGDELRRSAGHNAPGARKEFENIGEFLACVARNPNDQRLATLWGERRADQSMGDGPSGGFAVPTQFRAELMRVEGQPAMIRSRAMVLPAGSPPDAAITMPALDQDSTPTGSSVRGGVSVSWIGEGAAKPETSAKLRQITLEPKEVAAHLEATDKLLRNWQAGSVFLQTLLRDAIIAAEESAFLKGDGIAKPLGLLNSGACITVARGGAGISYDNVVGMLSKMLMRGGSPIWMASQSELPQLLTMEDTEGGLIFQPNARDGLPSTLLGYPLVWNEHSPQANAAGSLCLANLGYYLVKDGSGPFVAASEHVKFTENKTVFKVFWNVDGQPWLAQPFKQEGGYEVSPFVKLGASA